MRLYHGTTLANAEEVVQNGFRDATGNFGLFSAATGQPVNTTGVFFSDMVLDENEGVCSEAYFLLTIPTEQLASYEWMEEGKGYREWCIPASLANNSFTDRTIYSWEEGQESSVSAREESRGQLEPSELGGPGHPGTAGPALSFYRDAGEAASETWTQEAQVQEAQALRRLIVEISNRTLPFSAEEFTAGLSPQELEELKPSLEQTLGWLAAIRERLP